MRPARSWCAGACAATPSSHFCSKFSACIVAMEACCGAHHIGRALAGQGHEIRLMSPEYVRPYVKAQKNDDRDAEAIAEAASRPDHALRHAEVGGATRHADAPPRARQAGRRPDVADEPDPQPAAGARPRGGAGTGQAGRRPRRTARRRGSASWPSHPRADRRHAPPMGRARRAHQGLRRGVRRRRQGAGRCASGSCPSPASAR